LFIEVSYQWLKYTPISGRTGYTLRAAHGSQNGGRRIRQDRGEARTDLTTNRAVAGGWSVGSIVTLQSGFPFTPQLSYNPSNTGDTKNPVRPFVNPNFTGNVIIGSPNQWFNPSAFLALPNNSGFWGNLGRDTLIGPGLASWDFSVHKDTRN
jgi:hypothetical protein